MGVGRGAPSRALTIFALPAGSLGRSFEPVNLQGLEMARRIIEAMNALNITRGVRYYDVLCGHVAKAAVDYLVNSDEAAAPLGEADADSFSQCGRVAGAPTGPRRLAHPPAPPVFRIMKTLVPAMHVGFIKESFQKLEKYVLTPGSPLLRRSIALYWLEWEAASV